MVGRWSELAAAAWGAPDGPGKHSFTCPAEYEIA